MVNLKPAIKAILRLSSLTALTDTGSKQCSNWQRACLIAGKYEADLVNRFRADRHALRKVDGSILQGSVLSLAVPALKKATLEITDFGGATGDLGSDFLAVYPTSTYTVVENRTMVALMQGKTGVRFTTEIPSACDVFFTSGTLQYMDEPMTVLQEGLKSARLAAIMVRNSFSEIESFHVQKSWLFDNGTGPIPVGYSNSRISYPHRTIRESEIMGLANEMGFRCQSRLEESSGSLWDSYGKQIVFLRR